MDKEEIFSMKPGKELDIRVAEDVMGHKVISDEIFGEMEIFVDDKGNNVYCPLQPYSEDISVAQMVVIRMAQMGRDTAAFCKDDARPEVICRAALLAALQEKEDSNRKQRRSNLRIVT